MPRELTPRRLRWTATDIKAGLTLDELEQFLAEARLAEIPGDTVPTFNATWRATIKWIEVGG